MASDTSLIIRVLGAEQTVNSTANTIGGSSFVRALNANSGYAVITQQRVAANLANVSIPLAPGQEVLLAKAPSDTLTTNLAAGVLATPVKRF
jgi:hypothetical protein